MIKPSTSSGNYTFIDTQQGLNQLAKRLLNTDVIALDTEFHGEKRYYPELFLIQIADKNRMFLIDPLAVDIAPLAGVINAKTPIKVIHSATHDVEILSRVLKTDFNSVFDTQLAAAFLGYGHQPSLLKLIDDICGEYHAKGFTLSDWSARPLSEKQIDYALDDIKHLLYIYSHLSSSLKEKKRLGWYEKEFAERLNTSAPGQSLERTFRKVRSSGKIKKHSFPVLWALVKWRESTAQRLNKPKNYIIENHQLAGIASMAPVSLKTLSNLRMVPAHTLNKWGGEIVATVTLALNSPPEDLPSVPISHHAKPGESARMRVLKIYLKQKSRELKIADTILLPQTVLNRLARESVASIQELREIDGFSDWRVDALGDDLLLLLKGKLALAISNEKGKGLKFIRL